MLRALVTTVSGAVVSAPDRDASARATSVVVVPPLRPTTPPGTTRSAAAAAIARFSSRSEEHTSELQSRLHLVCRLLLEKKKTPSQRPLFWLAIAQTADD